MKTNITFEGREQVYLETLNQKARGNFIRCAVDHEIEEHQKRAEINALGEQICKELKAQSEWYAVRSELDLIAKTYSDCGCVMIGTSQSRVMIHNGLGDGTTRIGYMQSNSKSLALMHWEGTYYFGEGAGVYYNDCESPDAPHCEKINSGWYDAYSYQGIVALVPFERKFFWSE